MAKAMLIDLERCVGCWTCSMACKMGNQLADDQFRIIVRTLGSGSGIDRPAGVYPSLKMGWLPVYNTDCTFCATRVNTGEKPYCEYSCPTDALSYGEVDNPESDYAKALRRVRDAGYRIFELPKWEASQKGITYASRK